MSPSRLHSVVFDVNETLVDLSGLRQVFADLELPVNSLEWWFAALLRDGIALAASGEYGSFASLAGAALDEITVSSGRRTSPLAVTTLLSAFAELPLHADVAPAFARLDAMDVPVLALTNGDAAIARGFFKRAGLDSLVAVHSVEAVQLWKPRPEAYRHLAHEVGVEPRLLAMVASHPWDLHGASMVGFSTAWVNRDRRTFPTVFPPPDVEANTLGDVVERLIEYLG